MRLYLIYVTPPEETSDWTGEGISGRIRLLSRIWRVCEPFFGKASAPDVSVLPAVESASEKTMVRAVHVATKSAIDETLSRRFHYNATIAKLDELVNAMTAVSNGAPESPALAYAVHLLPRIVAPFVAARRRRALGAPRADRLGASAALS